MGWWETRGGAIIGDPPAYLLDELGMTWDRPSAIPHRILESKSKRSTSRIWAGCRRRKNWRLCSRSTAVEFNHAFTQGSLGLSGIVPSNNPNPLRQPNSFASVAPRASARGRQ